MGEWVKPSFSLIGLRKTWFNQARSELKRGKLTPVLEEMKTIRKKARGSRRQIMTSQINYLTKGCEKGRLNYDQVAALKLPIGSGAVESLIRQVVNLRPYWQREILVTS